MPKESVWDYPRPPRLEPVSARIRIVADGQTLADSTRAFRVLETSHPPVYYVPQQDIRMDRLRLNPATSFCEFKGRAGYWDLVLPGKTVRQAGWSYPQPSAAFAAIQDHIAFYASRVDECYVGDERVVPQPGDFYGGWITANIEGPFKGGPGTAGW